MSVHYLLALSTASFWFQWWSSSNISFNALPSRVWQFTAGAIAHELIIWQTGTNTTVKEQMQLYHSLSSATTPFLLEIEQSEITDREIEKGVAERSELLISSGSKVILHGISFFLSLIIFFIPLYPVLLFQVQTLRVWVIALTTAIITLGRVEERQSFLLTNRFIVYLGDISYVVYLVHWPVLITWKSYWDILRLSLDG
ncbi:hypothetical protein PENTCL1PPCAC_29848, partial [Pristionchus entomophagus]